MNDVMRNVYMCEPNMALMITTHEWRNGKR